MIDPIRGFIFPTLDCLTIKCLTDGADHQTKVILGHQIKLLSRRLPAEDIPTQIEIYTKIAEVGAALGETHLRDQCLAALEVHAGPVRYLCQLLVGVSGSEWIVATQGLQLSCQPHSPMGVHHRLLYLSTRLCAPLEHTFSAGAELEAVLLRLPPDLVVERIAPPSHSLRRVFHVMRQPLVPTGVTLLRIDESALFIEYLSPSGIIKRPVTIPEGNEPIEVALFFRHLKAAICFETNPPYLDKVINIPDLFNYRLSWSPLLAT